MEVKLNNDDSNEKEISEEKINQSIEHFLERIEDLKRSENLNWEEFNTKTNVSRSAIDSWRSKTKTGKEKSGNTAIPGIDKVLRIAYAFNVSPDWLLGFSTIPVTYKEWIVFIEKSLENGAVRPFYRPELDKRPPIYDDETQEKMEFYIESFMSGSFKSDTPETIEVPVEDYFNVEYTYTPQPDSIYDVTEDMDGIYPDILEIKDTFLRCIIACLHFYKKIGPEEYYKSFREHIINQYGNEKVLELDIYELRAPAKLLEAMNEKYDMGAKEHATVSGAIFAKYKSIRDINTKELSKIWNKLKFCKGKLDEGEIKTVRQLRQEYLQNPINEDDSK